MIIGAVHENINEQLGVNYHRPTRQHFKIFDGRWWRAELPETLAVKIPFIEQGFALMDAKFASWYFKRILKRQYLGTAKHFLWWETSYALHLSDFGPDLMWCGAAKEWLARQKFSRRDPCILTTVSSIMHMDSRTHIASC